MLKSHSFIVFVFLLFSSCFNYTKNTSNICPVHQEKMAKRIKKMQYGFITKDGNTPDAPYGSNTEGGGCIVGAPYAIGYVCPVCKKIYLQKQKK